MLIEIGVVNRDENHRGGRSELDKFVQ
jgi:hypothetical protein